MFPEISVAPYKGKWVVLESSDLPPYARIIRTYDLKEDAIAAGTTLNQGALLEAEEREWKPWSYSDE